MKKRSKIIALVTTLCLCLSLFVVGVLAAKSATFNVTSTLNFTADGVYVMVDASLKQGADVATAAVLSGEGAPSGQATYKAYSYSRVSGQDYPNGEASTGYFVDENGMRADTWAIGDINFTNEYVVVIYEFIFKNYSDFEVAATITNYTESVGEEPSLSSVLTSLKSNGNEVVESENQDGVIIIPAKTGQTPGTAKYTITITLKNFNNNLKQNLSINFSFKKYVSNDIRVNVLGEGFLIFLNEDYNNPLSGSNIIIDENDNISFGSINDLTSGDFQIVLISPDGKRTIFFDGYEEYVMIRDEGDYYILNYVDGPSLIDQFDSRETDIVISTSLGDITCGLGWVIEFVPHSE